MHTLNHLTQMQTSRRQLVPALDAGALGPRCALRETTCLVCNQRRVHNLLSMRKLHHRAHAGPAIDMKSRKPYIHTVLSHKPWPPCGAPNDPKPQPLAPMQTLYHQIRTQHASFIGWQQTRFPQQGWKLSLSRNWRIKVWFIWVYETRVLETNVRQAGTSSCQHWMLGRWVPGCALRETTCLVCNQRRVHNLLSMRKWHHRAHAVATTTIAQGPQVSDQETKTEALGDCDWPKIMASQWETYDFAEKPEPKSFVGQEKHPIGISLQRSPNWKRAM